MSVSKSDLKRHITKETVALEKSFNILLTPTQVSKKKPEQKEAQWKMVARKYVRIPAKTPCGTATGLVRKIPRTSPPHPTKGA